MSSIRRYLNYANIVATLALVFAMSGGALAAKRYLITSTNQISPRVLRKLKVTHKAGSTRRGSAGPKGPEGEEGEEGEKGEKGAEGAQGAPAPTTLPAGQSESGYYALAPGASSIATDVTFPIPLGAPVPETQVIYTKADTPVTHCGGPGQADPGFLCIYSSVHVSVKPPTIGDLESTPARSGTGRVGFKLEWKVTGAGPIDLGTYTVTGG
jgi:hypothetical protein